MAATRTGPPTPPPGQPRSGASQSPVPAPLRDAVGALDLLLRDADADGLVAVDVRRMAGELDLTTVAMRALLAQLVEAELILQVGRRVYALAGSRAAHLEEPEPPGPRTPPHDAVHEGTGSPLLW